MVFIHKGTVTKVFRKNEEERIKPYLEDGWERGKCKSHWINNGEKNILLKEGLPLPNGFVYGQSQDFKNKNRDGNIRRWKNMSEEEKKDFSNKISSSIKDIWDNMPEEDKYLREENRKHTRENWTEEQIYTYHKTMSESAKRNRSTITKEEYHRRSLLATETKKKNKTFSFSSYENIMYEELCKVYGSESIIREYIDSRYPFKCDFYIKPIDFFIELNIHPSHGDHPFDENSETDREHLQELKDKGDRWSNMVIDVWAGRDYEKHKIAKSNNLNYMSIYKKNFKEALNTIRSNGL